MSFRKPCHMPFRKLIPLLPSPRRKGNKVEVLDLSQVKTFRLCLQKENELLHVTRPVKIAMHVFAY